MKTATLWSKLDEQGRPVLRTDLDRADDPTLKENLLRFIDAGTPVVRASGLQDDELDRSRQECVPLAFLTDGDWIWPAELAYYLRTHNVLPERDFVRHAEAAEFRPRSPGLERLEAARQELAWE